jgi:hypothetical protein
MTLISLSFSGYRLVPLRALSTRRFNALRIHQPRSLGSPLLATTAIFLDIAIGVFARFDTSDADMARQYPICGERNLFTSKAQSNGIL